MHTGDDVSCCEGNGINTPCVPTRCTLLAQFGAVDPNRPFSGQKRVGDQGWQVPLPGAAGELGLSQRGECGGTRQWRMHRKPMNDTQTRLARAIDMQTCTTIVLLKVQTLAPNPLLAPSFSSAASSPSPSVAPQAAPSQLQWAVPELAGL